VLLALEILDLELLELDVDGKDDFELLDVDGVDDLELLDVDGVDDFSWKMSLKHQKPR